MIVCAKWPFPISTKHLKSKSAGLKPKLAHIYYYGPYSLLVSFDIVTPHDLTLPIYSMPACFYIALIAWQNSKKHLYPHQVMSGSVLEAWLNICLAPSPVITTACKSCRFSHSQEVSICRNGPKGSTRHEKILWGVQMGVCTHTSGFTFLALSQASCMQLSGPWLLPVKSWIAGRAMWHLRDSLVERGLSFCKQLTI